MKLTEIIETTKVSAKYNKPMTRLYPSSENWLELYSCMKGHKTAHNKIMHRVSKLLAKAKRLIAEKHIDNEKLAWAVFEIMQQELRKYDDFGASDTEPRCNIKYLIMRELEVDLYHF